MINISYNIGCRNCLEGSTIRHFYTLKEGDEKEIQKKSEFEIMKIIENWRVNDNYVCEFCSSSNVEVQKVEVNGHKLYDPTKFIQQCNDDDILFLTINIEKRETELQLNTGGSRYLKPSFKNLAILVY